ncbi:hypothetical protein LOTGIDRAFT_160813 [Lottia gigantea]|uniref:Uncharacterized protein n=1 Tax=Lottia gigantea TaxID=225164 RepID=V4AN62_LOTGI|nr:hypothetical protein LOTGIDRAFT_160813 [Lottia gigantea]ESO95051.1 hypothetical protein LOTGIDRAFT_160813 [Lottia gigantea]
MESRSNCISTIERFAMCGLYIQVSTDENTNDDRDLIKVSFSTVEESSLQDLGEELLPAGYREESTAAISYTYLVECGFNTVNGVLKFVEYKRVRRSTIEIGIIHPGYSENRKRTFKR